MILRQTQREETQRNYTDIIASLVNSILVAYHAKKLIDANTLSNIKEANLDQFLKLNNILLFLTSVKMYHFNTKHVVKKKNNHV